MCGLKQTDTISTKYAFMLFVSLLKGTPKALDRSLVDILLFHFHCGPCMKEKTRNRHMRTCFRVKWLYHQMAPACRRPGNGCCLQPRRLLHGMREGEDGMAVELESEEAQGLLAPPSSLPLIRPSE